jgi:PadR family transcriptional regulator AphA
MGEAKRGDAGEPAELLLSEWVVLGLLAEAPAHGFALARELSRDGSLGAVWTVSRPLTYRALEQLVDRGLVEPVRVEPGQGPRRQVHAITATGRAALRRWLRTPVPHLRDVRTELLVKLALLERAGRSPARLVASQRRIFAPMIVTLRQTRAEGAAALWRRESAVAVTRFLDALER